MNFNVLDRLWSYFAHDLAIDLGTANVLVLVKGKGIIINEPSVVAIHKKTKAILAVGREAKRMVGKTPVNIVAIRPLRDGVISDFDAAEQMLKYFIRRAHTTPRSFPPKIPRPRVVIGIPSGVTEVERKAVIDAVLQSGARQVFLVEEPMAAAIGAGLPVEEARGNLVVDIGGGTTEIAVISLGGVVVSRSIRVAGDEMDEAIVDWAREKYNLLVGERSAEEIKIKIGSAWDLEMDQTSASLRGRDLASGLPKEIEVEVFEVRQALWQTLKTITDMIRDVVEDTPPELLSDIYKEGAVLAGGGAQLKGIDRLVAEETKIPVRVAEDSQTAVVRGCGQVLEEMELLKKVCIS